MQQANTVYFLTLFSDYENPYNNLCGITVKHILWLLMFVPQNLRHVASYPSTGGHRELHFATLSPALDSTSLHILAKVMGKKILFRVSVLTHFI